MIKQQHQNVDDAVTITTQLEWIKSELVCKRYGHAKVDDELGRRGVIWLVGSVATRWAAEMVAANWI